ncbi:hypothetical protein N9A28_00845 [Sulfurimonas sp.]|nr:hypothetical protein [Sulfurimonas sp.]
MRKLELYYSIGIRIENAVSRVGKIISQGLVKEDLRILSKTVDSYLLLKAEEIFYVQADLAEVIIRSAKGFSHYAKKISYLEKQLEAYDFFHLKTVLII